MRNLLISLALFTVFTTATPACLADGEDWRQLHREVQAGRIRPLADILDNLHREWLGEVIEVEIERDDDRWIYEIEMLGPQGQVVEFEIDAGSGEILEIEGRNIRSMRRN